MLPTKDKTTTGCANSAEDNTDLTRSILSPSLSAKRSLMVVPWVIHRIHTARAREPVHTMPSRLPECCREIAKISQHACHLFASFAAMPGIYAVDQANPVAHHSSQLGFFLMLSLLWPQMRSLQRAVITARTPRNYDGLDPQLVD